MEPENKAKNMWDISALMDPRTDIGAYMRPSSRLWYKLIGDFGMAVICSIIVYVSFRVLIYAHLEWWKNVLVFLTGMFFMGGVYIFGVRYYRSHNQSI